jgi:glycosyltransferase involved in cell wall biosynthesis
VVGMCGPIGPTTGHDVLLRAGASLCHARSFAQLLIAGEPGGDPAAAALGKLAAQLGIAGRVRIIERSRDPVDLLASCDVLVDPALEARLLPLAVIEALASGTATVASDHPAVRELVTAGVETILTPPGDHEALAVALLALCDDPVRRAEIGAAGETAVRERFDAERMTRRIEALYRDVAAA